MQFQVPQFIEVEDKIFGPLTFKQFVFVVGGAGASYLVWRLLPSLIAIPCMIILAAFALALAFITYNDRPFIDALENGLRYLMRTKFYLWSNQRRMKWKDGVGEQKKAGIVTTETYVPKLSESKLRDLAWSLDIKERVAGGIARDEERGMDGVPLPASRTMRV